LILRIRHGETMGSLDEKLERFVKKLLYVCEADSGGIMEYAIRQSAAIAQEGVEVHFLCKPSFPVERLRDGIKVWGFKKSREARGESRGLAGSSDWNDCA